MFTTRPEIIGTFGVVASTHWLASSAGMAVLEKGGNAFDAAVAAGFVLQVVEPHLNGPGGEVPILLWDERAGRVEAICGQGTAPAAATIERYRSLGLEIVPGSGLLPAVVPGAFDAWMLMLRDHGTMRVGELLEYAIGYAENGYAVVPRISEAIANLRQLFEDEWVGSAEVYLPNGEVPAPYSQFRNPPLAAAYRRIVAEAEAAGGDREAQIEAARKAWYRGFVAETIDAFCRTSEIYDSSRRRHRGLLTGDDMAAWQATVEAPLTYDYHGVTVCKTGPWGQGPVFLQQLALLKGFDLGATDPVGPDFVHTVVECTKLAFADREAFYGDPDFVKVPIEQLLSDAYNDERRKLVGERASKKLRPGKIKGFGGPVIVPAEASEELPGDSFDSLGVGEPTIDRRPPSHGHDAPVHGDAHAPGDTCHLDVIDRHGNMVSATPSGGWLQSSPVIPGLGFCLTNRGQMFWLDPRSPSALAPRKRPRTTLTPSLALRDGRGWMPFGTPGGDQQDQWSLVFFLRHLHHGMNLQAAIDAPMFHTEHAPSSFYPRLAALGNLTLEGRFEKDVVRQLKRRGHVVAVGDGWSLGRISAAKREGGVVKAAANPRGMQGYAVGR
jgi:gamma-glutamyltranspeptidase / glutathione hydrolase